MKTKYFKINKKHGYEPFFLVLFMCTSKSHNVSLWLLVLASPQTSFGVRLSRIDKRTPKDVCGEAILEPAKVTVLNNCSKVFFFFASFSTFSIVSFAFSRSSFLFNTYLLLINYRQFTKNRVTERSHLYQFNFSVGRVEMMGTAPGS